MFPACKNSLSYQTRCSKWIQTKISVVVVTSTIIYAEILRLLN